MTEIYLDNAATTKPYVEVRDVMLRVMTDDFGNASSLHRRGAQAERAVAIARQHIKTLVGTSDWDVLFTSGGTEANNLAVHTYCPKGKRNAVITSGMEHASVIDTARLLAGRGCTLHVIGGGATGAVSPKAFAEKAGKDTALVSVIHVANEMGTVQPVNEIARAVKRIAPRVKVHVDAVQAAVQLTRLDYCREVDSVTISGHKIHGPQGVGALLFRTGGAIKPLFCGGDQQKGMRPGTLNLPAIVGMGEAARITAEKRQAGVLAMHQRMTEFAARICGDEVYPLGDAAHRAAGMLVVGVTNVKSEVLLHTLEKYNVLASAGSACHSTRTAPPRCLVEAGLKPEDGVVRFSIQYETSEEELSQAASIFQSALSEVRQGRAGI
ncbi:MAG: cysteine desulfurase [Deltaproteobacteria bacterium]|nr:cysteine desulfurase [Deltaproteobacteria bacterium]MBN2670334.1 cysteine desulfurase [Deltaproteobacteria bacterium]